MKKLLLCLLFLVWLCPGSAWSFSAAINAAAGSSSAASTECTDYLICQNWEGAGEDNGESWTIVSGGIDEDYTAAPAPLRGSQSASLINNGTAADYISPSFTNADEGWGQFLFNTSDDLADFASEIFRVYNNVGTVVARISISTGNILSVMNGSFGATAGSTVLSQSATYRIWWYYKKGTGGDGIATIWLALASGGTSRPGSSEATDINGNATTQADHVGFYNTNNELFIIDQCYVKSSEFTTVSE